MGTNCAPLLANIFLYSYEAGFIQSLLSTEKKQLATRFNLTYRYNVCCIVHKQQRIWKLSWSDVSCWTWDQWYYREHHDYFRFLPRLLSIRRDCQLHTSIYDKRNDFNFHITNFPFLSSNIPSWTYGVFISQLIRYARVCSSYVLFWEPCDFQVSYSNRDTSWIAWNRHSGSFMVDTEILFSKMKSPSHEC